MNLIDAIQLEAEKGIEEANSLPYAAYTDQGFYQKEAKAIFHSDWVFVCNKYELKNPGDYYAFDLAGEPVVVIRGRDGELRALSNSCSHRGTLLNDPGFGNQSKLICPYHAWTYTDKGQLMGVPYPGDVEIDKKAHCLPEFALEEWMGLVFVNIDGSAEPLAERYAGMVPYMQLYGIDQYEAGRGDTDYEYWDSNWKLVMENAMESYHLFKVHQPTLETVTPTKGAYYLEGHANWTLTAGETVDVGRAMGGGLTGAVSNALFKAGTSKTEQKLNENYLLVSLPPNFVGIATEDGMGYLSTFPEGPGRSRIRSGYVSYSLGKPSKTEEQFTQDFYAEDKFICERGQQSMTTQYNKGGKLVELERIVTDFHQYLASRVFGSPIPPVFKDKDADDFLNLARTNQLRQKAS